MPTNPQRPASRGWRVGGDADDGKRPWRKDKVAAEATGKGPSTRKILVWGLGIAFFVTIGTFVWVAIQLAPAKPAFLVILGAHYDDNRAIPPNLSSWRVATALKEFAGKGERKVLWWPVPRFAGKDWWLEAPLSAKALQGWPEAVATAKEDTVIVFLTAHGGWDEKRDVYFVLQDHNPYVGDGKPGAGKVLYLKELLAKLPREKKKLVVLDVAGDPIWSLGQLSNEFATHLKNELDRDHKETPNLLVVSACGPDQRAWTSEKWGRSVFGHFFLLGISGKADDEGDKSGRVEGEELVAYLTKHVQEWVSVNRDEVQTPFVWPDKDARPKDMQLAVAGKDVPAPTDPKPLDGLDKAWQLCENLRAQVPSPAVYAPHKLRLCYDLALRYEQVMRAGDPTQKASTLLGDLTALANDITAQRQLPVKRLNDLQATAAPMHAVLGQNLNWSPDYLRELDNLCATTDESKRKAILSTLRKQLVGNKDVVYESLLRVQAAERALQHAGKGLKEADLDQLPRLLRFLQDTDPHRPVEEQTFLILEENRNRAKEPPLSDLAAAVRVALLAERTALAVGDLAGEAGKGTDSSNLKRPYPSSERIQAWITDDLKKADEARRDGLDWLLGGGEEDWAKARNRLKEAEQLYGELQKKTAVLRRAFALRDEVLAELPYYTQWLVRFRLNPDRGPRLDEEKKLSAAMEAALSLWDQVHLLNARLREADLAGVDQAPKATKLDPTPLSLSARLRKLEMDLGKVRAAYDEARKGLSGSEALQTRWHHIEAVLATPFIPAKERMSLVESSRTVAVKLQDGYEGRVQQQKPREAVDERVEDQLRRQGLLAVAALGRAWLEEKEASYDELVRQMVNPTEGRVTVQRTGQKIGDLWRKLPHEVRVLTRGISDTDKWRGAGSKDYLKKIAPDLMKADSWCRLLDGAAVESLKFGGATPDSLKLDPVDELRRLQLHNLFAHHAERAWNDHWWCTLDEHKSSRPAYYQGAVATYLDAAHDLILHKVEDREIQAWRRAHTEELRKWLVAAKIDSKPNLPPPLLWTTEQALPVEWKINGQGMPKGVAMFQLELNQWVKPAPGAGQPELRRSWDIKQGEDKLTYRLALKPSDDSSRSRRLGEPDKAPVKLKGVFRGQPIPIEEKSTLLHIYRDPDTIVYHVAPESRAGLAVSADPSWNLGTVVMVLDISGSMDWPLKDGTKKIAALREAFATALKRIPKGTRLSIWAYGQQKDKVKNVTEDPAQAEAVRIEGPFTWSPDQYDRLVKKINDLKPMNTTPLVDAMTKAKADFVNGPGLKTLLVLTDGADTHFAIGLGLSENQRIAKIRDELRTQFPKRGDRIFDPEKHNIIVNMLLFEDDDKEIQKARRQLKETVENLAVAGYWYEVKQAKELPDDLWRALRPQLRLLRNAKDISSVDKEFAVKFQSETTERWLTLQDVEINDKLGFEAWVQGQHQDLYLRRGDCMIMLLKPDAGKGVRFERALYANLYAQKWADKDNWRVGLQQYMPDQNGHPELRLSVEKTNDVAPGNDGYLRLTPRGFVWLEMKANGEHRPGLRWGKEWFHPGPTWKLNHNNWPTTTPPQLDIWWQEDPKPDAAQSVTYKPDSKQTFQEALAGEKVLEDVTAVIESVEVVENYPPATVKEGSAAKVDALVVRLNHKPANRPVWVSLDGLSFAGSEHRFYSTAGKVTAAFWPVTKTLAQEKGFTLRLTSLNQFKSNKATLHLNGKELGIAEPNAAKRPPVELRRD